MQIYRGQLLVRLYEGHNLSLRSDLVTDLWVAAAAVASVIACTKITSAFFILQDCLCMLLINSSTDTTTTHARHVIYYQSLYWCRFLTAVNLGFIRCRHTAGQEKCGPVKSGRADVQLLRPFTVCCSTIHQWNEKMENNFISSACAWSSLYIEPVQFYVLI